MRLLRVLFLHSEIARVYIGIVGAQFPIENGVIFIIAKYIYIRVCYGLKSSSVEYTHDSRIAQNLFDIIEGCQIVYNATFQIDPPKQNYKTIRLRTNETSKLPIINIIFYIIGNRCVATAWMIARCSTYTLMQDMKWRTKDGRAVVINSHDSRWRQAVLLPIAMRSYDYRQFPNQPNFPSFALRFALALAWNEMHIIYHSTSVQWSLSKIGVFY